MPKNTRSAKTAPKPAPKDFVPINTAISKNHLSAASHYAADKGLQYVQDVIRLALHQMLMAEGYL